MLLSRQTYQFQSGLSVEQMRARLRILTRPMAWGWQLEEHQVFAKLLQDGRFYLLKTGGAFQVRPLIPFVGTLTPTETGCCISGGFQPPKAMGNLLITVMLVVFLLGMAITGPRLSAALAFAAALLLWGGGVWLLWAGIAPKFSRRQQAETIGFIEQNLLRE